MGVAAVVVTFNRKTLLLECLASLLNQTKLPDSIYIVDGPSKDGTPEALLENGYINSLPPEEYDGYLWKIQKVISKNKEEVKITYARIFEDVGGAGGFYEGMKMAHEDGHEWIWIMDDDAEPDRSALEELLKFTNLPECLVLTPIQITPHGDYAGHRGIFEDNDFLKFKKVECSNRDGAIEIQHSSFVGPLINKQVIETLGLPKKEFFIWYDDVEYSLRLKTRGKMYLVCSSKIIHKENAHLIIKQFGKLMWGYVPYSKLWKYYFKYRNWAFLGKKYSPIRHFMLVFIHTYVKKIIGTILLDDHKMRRIVLLTRAYFDGLLGTFDNERPKRILYGKEKA